MGGPVDPDGGSSVPRGQQGEEPDGSVAGETHADGAGAGGSRAGAFHADGSRAEEDDCAPDTGTGRPGSGLPKLMARLGRLLERFGPEGVVVMSCAEYERMQMTSYASGWQDAAEEYRPRIAAARWEGWLGRWRPLRVVEESGEVVDLTAHGLPEWEDAEPDGPAGEETGDAAADGGPGGTDPQRWARGHGRTPVPRAFLSPKNRRSKSPTIPRLPAQGHHRPRTASDAPDEAPE